MTRRPLPLIVSAVLFAAWIGWLAVQAHTHARPVVVSRAQLLASNLDVVAELDSPEQASVRVVQVLFDPARTPTTRPGQDLTVADLALAVGFRGPGRYLLPLRQEDDGRYRLAVPPLSPGYTPFGLIRPTIYPWGPDLQKQYEASGKPQLAPVRFRGAAAQ